MKHSIPPAMPSLPLVYPLIEIFLLSLLIVLFREPIFGVQKERMPFFDGLERFDVPSEPESTDVIHVVLKADGTLLVNDEALPCAVAIERLASDPTNAPVQVIVESHGNGGGSVHSLMEFQLGCGRAGLAPRMMFLYCPKEVPS